MADSLDLFDALLKLVNEVKALVYDSGSKDSKANGIQELCRICRDFVSQLEPSLPNKTASKCHVLASDLLVRLECSRENDGTVNEDVLSRIWTDEHLLILTDRLETIRMDFNKHGNHTLSQEAFVTLKSDKDTKQTETSISLPSNGSVEYDSQSERFIMLRDFFLDGLAFAAMADREEQVTKAYNETFDWIYRDNSHAFASWLRSDPSQSMYWINGLPGSGKSTLMRYINEREQTMELLREWAGEKYITMASFFFWESGTAVQRSQAGLLRSLLHQLLSKQPELIPNVFPNLWAEIWTADARTRIRLTSTWSITDLSDAFRRFFQIDHGRHVCLFVDGLDEFEGDHCIMIDLLNQARQHPHTKLCVSSRPWNVFEQAFQNVPALRLQELTANDIVRFVRGKFEEIQHLRLLMEIDQPAAAELINSVVHRADGVFLWVSLAVRTVMEKYEAGENLSDIQRRVENLPPSLNDLFRHLLSKPNLESQARMSRVFQLIRAREFVCDFIRDDDANSLTVWEMALTDDNIDGFNLDCEVERVSDHQMNRLCRQKITEIRGQCAGLIEIHRTRAEKRTKHKTGSYNPYISHRKVMYLHRTVKDYLKNDDIWNEVTSHLPDLDPHFCHVRAAVRWFMFPLGAPRKQRNINEWWLRIVLCMTHGRYSLPCSRQVVFEHLNSFDNTLNWYWPPRNGSVAIDSWSRSCFGSYEERGSIPYPDPYLSLTTKFGVASYVETYLDTWEYEYEQQKPLLSYAVEYLVNRQNSVYPLSDPHIVDVFFANGENPNLTKQPALDGGDEQNIVEDGMMEMQHRKPPPKLKTPWVLALEAIQQAHRRGWIEVYDVNPEGTTRWARILRTFLNHGANPNVMIEATYKDKKETALELITRLFEAYHAKEIGLVRELLLSKLQDQQKRTDG